jgi:hypothetical protein
VCCVLLQVELYALSKEHAPNVTVLRLEDVSSNFSRAVRVLLRALLPTLHLPSTNEHEHARIAHLERAVAKFDLSRNAPMPDKASHVSAKADKQRLRDALMRDTRLRPLLRGMRQVLDYEALHAWQHPPDVHSLSHAIESSSSAFWKAVGSGRLGSRLRPAYDAKGRVQRTVSKDRV